MDPPPGADTTKAANVYALTRSQAFGKEVQRRILLGTYALTAEYVTISLSPAIELRH